MVEKALFTYRSYFTCSLLGGYQLLEGAIPLSFIRVPLPPLSCWGLPVRRDRLLTPLTLQSFCLHVSCSHSWLPQELNFLLWGSPGGLSMNSLTASLLDWGPLLQNNSVTNQREVYVAQKLMATTKVEKNLF